MDNRTARAVAQIGRIPLAYPVGRVSVVGENIVAVSGLGDRAKLGDRVSITDGRADWRGEVIGMSGETVDVLCEADLTGVTTGLRARVCAPVHFAPCDDWIGRVIDPDGEPLDGRALPSAVNARAVVAPPPQATRRRPLGARFGTGLAVFDTLLPIVRGQRIGLFAGSGVGKSTLMGELARGVDADVIVIGLVGERAREVREFVDKVLGPDGLARSVVVAATSDRAPQTRRRCAWASMAVAEHFRDQGKQVLLLMDSVTRFAEAHREVCTAAGQPSQLRGFPASTAAAIAALCERAGPGCDKMGDITAVFTVLVAGSDMEEPVADILRGVLDGHVVLDRKIAERGRFPAVDVLRSVSRSLPDAASDAENALIAEARSVLGTYDQAQLMVQSGLYVAGSDPAIDRAIALNSNLDRFQALRVSEGPQASFAALRSVFGAG